MTAYVALSSSAKCIDNLWGPILVELPLNNSEPGSLPPTLSLSPALRVTLKSPPERKNNP